jgi:hypothetical protein
VSGAIRIIILHFERMQIYISVWTIARAQSASDAPVFDNYFQRIAPPDRSYRAANHTQRVAALPAARSDQILLETQTVAHKSGHAVMSVGTGIHASIAARALL